MTDTLKETLTVICQGGQYLLNTGGYNTHLAIDGKQFAKTSKLQLDYEPKKIEVGQDKSEPDYWTRTVDGKEERLDNDAYQHMVSTYREECLNDTDGYLSLEHEYKYKKATSGWQSTRKDWVEWTEYPFQILHLATSTNPCITPYLADKDYTNPVVIYTRNKAEIVKDAFNRLGIDILTVDKSSSYDGIPKKLSRDSSGWSNDDFYKVMYDKHRIVESDDFKRPAERITLKEAEELYEKDVESVIQKYKRAYALVHAKITEENGQELAELLEKLELKARSLPVYAKSRDEKQYLLNYIKKAKELLGTQ